MKQTDRVLLRAPTDLSNFLGCRHLSALDLRVARGEARRPVRHDVVLEDLRARGFAHERAYLARLREQGLTIAGAGPVQEGAEAAAGDAGYGLDVAATLAAMRSGVDVIYQAALECGAWSGRVDFLRKVDTPSQLGDWSYEAYDTKLARDTKAGTILQLCVYSYLLETDPGHASGPHVRRHTGHELRRRELPDRRLRRLLPPARARHRRIPGAAGGDLPGAGLALRLLRVVVRSASRGVGPTITSATWPASRPHRSGRCASSTSTRSPALAVLEDVPEPARGSRDALIRVREQARDPEARPRHAGRRSTSSSSPSTPSTASRCCPSRQRTTSSSTSKAIISPSRACRSTCSAT